jgi:hypothetical protein
MKRYSFQRRVSSFTQKFIYMMNSSKNLFIYFCITKNYSNANNLASIETIEKSIQITNACNSFIFNINFYLQHSPGNCREHDVPTGHLEQALPFSYICGQFHKKFRLSLTKRRNKLECLSLENIFSVV